MILKRKRVLHTKPLFFLKKNSIVHLGFELLSEFRVFCELFFIALFIIIIINKTLVLLFFFFLVVVVVYYASTRNSR